MSCVNDQTRRQQALTRVAASRVRVVDSAESVRRGVQGCVRAFPLSGTALKVGGGVLTGLVIAGVVAKKLSGKKTKKMPQKAELKGSTVALQALSALAIPLLQRWLITQTAAQPVVAASEPAQKPTPARFSLPDINGMFYRWLGLQK